MRRFQWLSRSFGLTTRTPFTKTVELVAAGALTGTYYYCVVAENPTDLYIPSFGYEGQSSGRYYKDSNNLSIPVRTFARSPSSQNVKIQWWNTRGGVTKYYVYRATNADFTANLLRQDVAEGYTLNDLGRYYTEFVDDGTGWVSTTVKPTLTIPNNFWHDIYVTDPGKIYNITDLIIQAGDLSTLSSPVRIDVLDKDDNLIQRIVNAEYLSTLSSFFMLESTYFQQTQPITLFSKSDNWTDASPADGGVINIIGNGDFNDLILIMSISFTVTKITGDLGGGNIVIEKSFDFGETWINYITINNWNDIANISSSMFSGVWKTLDFLSFIHAPVHPLEFQSNIGHRMRIRRTAQITGADELYVGMRFSIAHHNNCYKMQKMNMARQYNPVMLNYGQKLKFYTTDNSHIDCTGFRFNLSGYYS